MRHRHTHTDHRQSPPFDGLKAPYPNVLRALQGWHKDTSDAPLADLLLYEQARHRLGSHADARVLTAHVLEEGLRRLATVDADAVHLLRQRFQQDLSRQQLAIQYHRSLPHFDRMQRDAVLELAQAIDEAEQEARAAALYRRTSRFASLHLRLDLAAGNDRLFGIDTYSSALVECLQRPGPPPIFYSWRGWAALVKLRSRLPSCAKSCTIIVSTISPG